MNNNWNLNNLYNGFTDPKFLTDVEMLPSAVTELVNFAKTAFVDINNASEKLENYIKKTQDFSRFYNILRYCSLVSAVDSENKEALKYMSQAQIALSEGVVASTLFTEFISKVTDLQSVIDASKLLKEHEFFLVNAKENAQYLLSTPEEVIVAKLRITGSTAWNTLYSQLTSTLEVDFDYPGFDNPQTLSEIRNLAYHADAEVRKAAYHAELAAYPKIEKSIAAALNAIKGEAITNTKLRGYDSILDMTLKNSRMDKKTLDVLIETMKDSLPLFTKYFKHKASKLGLSDGLPFYDLFAPIGESNVTFSKEEGSEFMIKNFTDFDPELGEFAQTAIDEGWVDWEPKKGKVGGAFCANLHNIKESRVLMNYSGSFGDVLTLAHEFGHAYHGYALKDESFLNSNYSMPIAEVASIFCETLVCNAALKTATDAEKLSIIETNLQGSSQVIVDIYSRYLFESELVKRREAGNLSVDELNDIMANAQKEAYSDGLTDEIHPYMWLCKGHYYSAGLGFYNFPYAYGLLFAKGLYKMYLDEGSAFAKKYKDLLTATGKNDLYTVGKIVGIDIHDKSFWQGAIDVIAGEIELFLSL